MSQMAKTRGTRERKDFDRAARASVEFATHRQADGGDFTGGFGFDPHSKHGPSRKAAPRTNALELVELKDFGVNSVKKSACGFQYEAGCRKANIAAGYECDITSPFIPPSMAWVVMRTRANAYCWL